MKLTKYNNKRDFTKTKEPIGKLSKSSKTLKFSIQHHLAHKDHFDLRLEHDGVLVSFAVPKGLSYNPKDKRLAVRVEDHPLSYLKFEGIIPQGSYGAGIVMLFDYGTYTLIEKPNFTKGPIKFKLNGKRLKGIFTLIKYKDNNWLLIKDKDGLFIDLNKFTTSVKTNLTFKELVTNNYTVSGVTITNPDKVIYKNPKVTKYEIALYYEFIAELMLPYLKNHPLSVVRAPSGIDKTTFFKKHLESHPGLHKKNGYFYINDIKGLINEVEMNSYEFHISSTTVNSPKHTNYLIFDLDPDKSLSITKIRQGLIDLKSILDNLKLDSYVKTSGKKGYHVIVPIKKITIKKAKEISLKIATIMVTSWPDKYTTNIKKSDRSGKIFIDYLRNSEGATCVCPYSLRINNKPTISMPISWEQINSVKPNDINIFNYKNIN